MRSGPLRTGAIIGAAMLVMIAVAVLAADVAASEAEAILRDAGMLARHGGPLVALLANLAAALTLGAAVVAGWCLPAGATADRRRLMAILGGSTAVWTLLQGASMLISYAVATGQPIGSPRFGSDMPVFLATDLGVWMLTAVILTALTTVIAVAGSTRGLARAVAAGSSVALFAKAMTGHASGSADHETATTTMAVHLLAMGIWVGGLAALQLLPRRPAAGAMPTDDATAVRRYSHLAAICWVALWISGIWALATRMNTIDEVLISPYVQLGVLKAILLALLGALGVRQRLLLAGAGIRPRPFRRLAAIELGLMGLAIALAAAMSSSPPPADETLAPPGPAGRLTGFPLPPAPDVSTALGTWRPDAFGLAFAALALLLWFRPGAPHRPAGRSLAVIAGALAVAATLSGPLGVYGRMLVSAHVLQHGLLLVLAGPLLAAGITVPSWLRRLVRHSRALAIGLAVLPPLLLTGVYASPFLHLGLATHVGHMLLILLALGGGIATALVLRGLAEESSRTLAQVAAVAAALPLMIAAEVLVTGERLAAASWFGATGRPWLADALADQQRAGWLLLALAILALIAALVVLGRADRGRRPRSSRLRSRAARTPSAQHADAPTGPPGPGTAAAPPR
ncbi:MAG: cytochrome c oxidase assembly protein [Brachybacterium sp.]|nr:cytochrome c oxidase assembly protein [Brachybacterium sp.]